MRTQVTQTSSIEMMPLNCVNRREIPSSSTLKTWRGMIKEQPQPSLNNFTGCIHICLEDCLPLFTTRRLGRRMIKKMVRMETTSSTVILSSCYKFSSRKTSTLAFIMFPKDLRSGSYLLQKLVSWSELQDKLSELILFILNWFREPSSVLTAGLKFQE